MRFYQREVRLPAFPRGFHLVTDLILREMPEIREIDTGMMQVFIKHTSAGLTLNENADPTVRSDFESHFNQMVPENAPATTVSVSRATPRIATSPCSKPITTGRDGCAFTNVTSAKVPGSTVDFQPCTP